MSLRWPLRSSLAPTSGASTGDLRAHARPARPGRRRRRGRRAEIIAAVRTRGDAAVRDLTERFDGCRLDDLAGRRRRAATPRSTPPRSRSARRARVRRAIRSARATRRSARRKRTTNAPASALRGARRARSTAPVATCPADGRRYPSIRADDRDPGARRRRCRGRAVRPARGRRHRRPTPMLAAAALAGVDEVYRIGGAQAIAALAYGTETIRAVDVIVGPGNAYVAEAKREVAGDRRHRRRSRARRRSSSSPTAASTRAGSRPTSSRRPSTVPAARPSLITWDADVADAVDAALDGLLATHARRPRSGRDARVGRPDRARRRPDAAIDAVNADRARAPRAHVRRRRAARRRSCATRARCSSGRGRPRCSATTSRASTTCCPPRGTARFASALPRRRLPQARARRLPG